MPSRLFGTDGIRGTAGVSPLDAPTVARLGAALVRALPRGRAPARLLIGRDTRESGPWLERALAHGVRSEGASLVSAGVLPTPAIAYLSGTLAFDAGVVISASHNPYQDNGIKVSGTRPQIWHHLEAAVEAIVADPRWQVAAGDLGPPVETQDFSDAYLSHVRAALPEPKQLGRPRLAVDCAYGATFQVGSALLSPSSVRVHDD